MTRRLSSAFSAIAVAWVVIGGDVAADGRARVGNAVLEPVLLENIAGYPGSSLGAALTHFRSVCSAEVLESRSNPSTRVRVDFSAVCEAAQSTAFSDATSFFASRFDAFRVIRPATDAGPGNRTGFLTGYFEPELEGSYQPTATYTTAILARPDDLISFAPGETPSNLDPTLRAGRRIDDRLEPYPDRAAIEDGALEGHTEKLLFLRDAVDLFVLQVQGSGRVHLPDGTSVRVLYDGRNGRPYTSIAKLIVTEGHLPLRGLTLARWTGWLRDHPDDARRLMRANASYIFFRLDNVADTALGPSGAANVPLVPEVSLAVDAALWPYGVPFWLEGRLSGTRDDSLGRIVVAADTGSAIVGPARGDLFVGTGAEAGVIAGNLRDEVGFVVLLPKPIQPKP